MGRARNANRVASGRRPLRGGLNDHVPTLEPCCRGHVTHVTAGKSNADALTDTPRHNWTDRRQLFRHTRITARLPPTRSTKSERARLDRTGRPTVCRGKDRGTCLPSALPASARPRLRSPGISLQGPCNTRSVPENSAPERYAFSNSSSNLGAARLCVAPGSICASPETGCV